MKNKIKYILFALLLIFIFFSILITVDYSRVHKLKKYVPEPILKIAQNYIFYIPQAIAVKKILTIENGDLKIINNKNKVTLSYLYGEKQIDKDFYFEKHNINTKLNKILVPFHTPEQKMSKKTFYIHEKDENIFLFYQSGKIQYFPKKDLTNKKTINFSDIKNNLYNNIIFDNEMFYGVKHILEIEDIIYLTYTKIVDNCYSVEILKSKISKQEMLFKPFFETGDCIKKPPEGFGLYSQGGKMIKYKGDKILMTTGEFGQGIRLDLSQDDKRIWGKIISIDLKTKEYKIFTKGHRNPQGLYWDKDKDLILETEHGPTGGDEINLLQFGKNYGYPFAYYGEVDGDWERQELYDPSIKKTHKELGFVEPITYFTPAIAPSGIVKTRNTKNLNFDNYFFVHSLRAQSLYLLKFEPDYKKIELIDHIDLNERIRHMIYLEKEKIYLLALESSSSLGILRIID